MTTKKAKPTAADYAAQDVDRVKTRNCPRCGSEVLCARAGRIAALDVTADPKPITPLEELTHLLAGRLTWHLIPSAIPGTPARIAWRCPTHIQAGPARWPVIADHHCPPQPVQETLL